MWQLGAILIVVAAVIFILINCWLTMPPQRLSDWLAGAFHPNRWTKTFR